MRTQQELAPTPAEMLVNAAIVRREAEGYTFLACLRPGQLHERFFDIHGFSYRFSETFEEPLDGFDYLANQMRHAKDDDFEVIYVLEAGTSQEETIETTADDSTQPEAQHILVYMPGAVSFLARPIN